MSTQAIEKDSELKDLSHQVRAVTIEIRKMVEHANNVLVHFAAAEDKARSIEWDLEIHRSELAKVMSEIDSIKKLNQELRKEGQEYKEKIILEADEFKKSTERLNMEAVEFLIDVKNFVTSAKKDHYNELMRKGQAK